MPADWIPNCATQLERAIRALFIGSGAATAADCFISNESEERAGIATGITTVRCSSSDTTDPEGAGNEKFQVTIQNKFFAAQEESETNVKLNRVEMDMRVGRQMLAMLAGTNGRTDTDVACASITTYGRALADVDSANESDMEEFTCLFGRYLGMTRGVPEDLSCSWVEVRNFEITACPTAVD